MSGSNWESGIRGTVFDTTGSIRRDGQAQAGIDVGNAHILTFIHDRDGWPPEGSTTPTASSFFKAALGRYNDYKTTGNILRVYDSDYCEILAFDRALSDSEMRQVENYLITKWKTLSWTEGNPPAESEATFAEGTALNIGNGARVDMGNAPVTVKTLANDGLGGTLAGSVTLEDAFLVDAQNRTALLPIVVEGDLSLGASATVTVQNHTNLTRAARHHALTATGTVAGEFSSVIGITRPWEWLRGDKT